MRLIDADALMERMKRTSRYFNIKFDIEEAPTIEAEPVRHGRWVKQWCDTNMIGHEYAGCSVCGCAMLDTNQFWSSKYCPNCGAKMDGDSHEV